jgi:Tfp pilus assembly protein PilE
MKTMIRLVLISMLMVIASPAYSEAIQIFNCELEGDATYSEVNAMTAKWLTAAKAVKGGENLKVYIRYPVAASSDDIDFKFVLTTPNFADWGAFTDAYEDNSALTDLDDEIDKVAECNDSSLWEGAEVK